MKIVAYIYRADVYCPGCILGVLNAPHDGNVELVLDELASERGIDRYDERSYDSGEFPKVVFSDQIESDEHCGNCGSEL